MIHRNRGALRDWALDQQRDLAMLLRDAVMDGRPLSTDIELVGIYAAVLADVVAGCSVEVNDAPETINSPVHG